MRHESQRMHSGRSRGRASAATPLDQSAATPAQRPRDRGHLGGEHGRLVARAYEQVAASRSSQTQLYGRNDARQHVLRSPRALWISGSWEPFLRRELDDESTPDGRARNAASAARTDGGSGRARQARGRGDPALSTGRGTMTIEFRGRSRRHEALREVSGTQRSPSTTKCTRRCGRQHHGARHTPSGPDFQRDGARTPVVERATRARIAPREPATNWRSSCSSSSGLVPR